VSAAGGEGRLRLPVRVCGVEPGVCEFGCGSERGYNTTGVLLLPVIVGNAFHR